MIADLKPYPAMKDSGVEWLGEVPEHWEVRQLGRMGTFSKGNGGTKEDEVTDGVSCIRYGDLYMRHEFLILKSRSYVTREHAVDYAPIQYGDVLFAGSGETIAEIGKSAVNLIESEACCGGDIILFRPSIDVEPKFMGYATDCPQAIYQKACMGRGVTVMHIYGNQLKYMWIALPPLPEQTAIVRYLDYVDRRVRRYVRAKQKLIEVLNEQKQAIINQAVTRGLDPNVPLKPSGVEWLGEIPEHWEVQQLRRIVQRGRRITYGIVQPGEPDTSGRFMVRGQDYSFGWASPENIFRVSDEIEMPYQRSRLAAGDLVLTIVGAGVGNVAIVPDWLDGANITQTTARVSLNQAKANAEFIRCVLEGQVGRRNVELYVKGAAQPGLNLEHVRIFIVPLPPLEEQSMIIETIHKATAPLEVGIKGARRETDLIREYRTRLIADVVTGKVDVRQLAQEIGEVEEDLERFEADEGIDGEEMQGDGEPELIEEAADAGN